MRGVATRYAAQLQPAVIKKKRSEVAHIGPPSNGLSFLARTNATDQQFAGVLTNFYVDDDRINIRSGFRKVATMPGALPIEHLIPYYGEPERLAAASNHTLYNANDGSVIKAGFTSDDWHWTSFSNLGDQEYTIMVNGHDGVFSWDGTPTSTPNQVVSVISMTSAASAPAVCTVAAGDISKFHNGQKVWIAGAAGPLAGANGFQVIGSVGTPANTFTLTQFSTTTVDTQTTPPITATIMGTGTVERNVIVPPGNTWLNVDEFNIVLAHQNRLWFADESNLAVYYMPLQSMDGTLEVLPLNAIFKKGGTIKSLATWTVDGGMGLDDQLVIFTTNGECAIYSGVDPDTDIVLVGVYRADPPMSKHSVINYGGDLYVLLPTGVTPMTAMIKAGKEGMETVDRSVIQEFLTHSIAHRDEAGWELFLNPSTGRLFCNLPMGGGRYQQMIRHMPKAVWSKFQDVPSRCWGWVNPYVYFGDDAGNVYQMHPIHRTDDGKPIHVEVQMAWSQFKTAALKHFKMVLPYIITDGSPRPFVDVKVDYDSSPIQNQPELSGVTDIGSEWDVAEWDVSDWVGGSRIWANWTGVGGLGRVGAVSLSANVSDSSFSVTGFDILFEEGSVFG